MSTTKYLMIHADDSGLALSENQATQIGMLKGSISSTSLMVPCPWFYEMSQFFLRHPNLDYGIHLTLTGEWKTYPFIPCLSAKKVPSLVNELGYFHSKREPIRVHAKTEEVYFELKKQIEISLNAGLKPSHFDSHMYTLGLRQDLIEVYKSLGEEFNLPILLSKNLIRHTGVNPDKFEIHNSRFFESIFMASFKDFKNGGLLKYYDNLLDNLPTGLSILLIHPALKSKEMDKITENHPNFGGLWRSQDAQYFSSTACREKLEKNDIELVNWKSKIVLSQMGA